MAAPATLSFQIFITMNLLSLINNRNYAVAFIEGNGCYSNVFSLDSLLTDTDDEFKYAIHERMDEILSLPVGGRLQMAFNRDNPKDSEGFIKRIESIN